MGQNTMTAPRTHRTPWGAAQDVAEVAPGITRIDTASHGGYHLDRKRQAEVVRRFPHFKTFAGGPWYEEDQDRALVCLTFPDCFPTNALPAARRVVEYSARAESDPAIISRMRNWTPRGWASVRAIM